MTEDNDVPEREDRRRRKAQDAALLELLPLMNYAQAAERVGVHRRTVERRMADPEFAAQVHARRLELFSALGGRVLSHVDEALDVLVELMRSAKSADRAGSAKYLLQTSFKVRERFEPEAQIYALRRVVEGLAERLKELGGGKEEE
jgi:hypothetical protein